MAANKLHAISRNSAVDI